MDRNVYLASLRRSTAYPTFRAFVGLVKWASYVLGGLTLTGGLYQAVMGGSVMGLIGSLVLALVIMVVGRIGAEASLMLADIADAAIDGGASRRSGG